MFFNAWDRRVGILLDGWLLAGFIITCLVISQLVLFYCLTCSKLRLRLRTHLQVQTEHYACGAVSSRLVFVLPIVIHLVMLTLMNAYATSPLHVMFHIVIVGRVVLRARKYTNVSIYI